MNYYNNASFVTISTKFIKQGSPFDPDPSSIYLNIHFNGDKLSFEYGLDNIIKDSIGNYHYDFYTNDGTGLCQYRWMFMQNGVTIKGDISEFYVNQANPFSE